MKNSMDIVKVSITQDNSVTIRCPYCNATKIYSVEQFNNPKKIIRITCLCEKIFQLRFEFRKRFRKEIELQGLYVNYSKDNDEDKILVKNISMSGIGFITRGRHRIEKNHELKIEITLDDKNTSIITKKAIVKLIREKYIGCEFICKEHYDKILGFYLRP